VRRVPRAERGFILIGALWLLILCGAIVAVLMLRGIESATAASDGEDALRNKLALESAVEAVVADLLFNGPQSHWALLPAEGAVAVDDRQIRVTVSNEAGRLDLNEVDPVLLETALQGFGIDAGRRILLVEALRAVRTAKQPIGSLAEMRALLATTIGMDRQARCLENQLTIFSGLVRPRENQLSPELARALGIATIASRTPAEPGSALRVMATAPGGGTLSSTVQIKGLLGEAYSASAWEFMQGCK